MAHVAGASATSTSATIDETVIANATDIPSNTRSREERPEEHEWQHANRVKKWLNATGEYLTERQPDKFEMVVKEHVAATWGTDKDQEDDKRNAICAFIMMVLSTFTVCTGICGLEGDSKVDRRKLVSSAVTTIFVAVLNYWFLTRALSTTKRDSSERYNLTKWFVLVVEAIVVNVLAITSLVLIIATRCYKSRWKRANIIRWVIRWTHMV